MIPKIIHYVWVGGKDKPAEVLKYIDSWKKFCPDYQIIEWNEANFDINKVPFVKEAIENKKFAFASDYMRLYALFNYGGIYMDTDVEVLKPLDEFLNHKAFTGFENRINIPTAIMGSEKHHPWIKLLLDYYNDRHFVNDGKLDTMTNVNIISALTKIEYNFKDNNKYQELEDNVVLYPNDYFCPKDYATGEILLTKNTYTIHHFNGSWLKHKNNFGKKIVLLFKKIFGKKIFAKVQDHYVKKSYRKNYKKIEKEYKAKIKKSN